MSPFWLGFITGLTVPVSAVLVLVLGTICVDMLYRYGRVDGDRD